MCDCYQCNMTKEQQIEENNRYIEWEYKHYKKITDKPLPFEEWLEKIFKE